MNRQHAPVMLQESLKGLNILPNGIYVDATFGCGGHSREILKCLGPKGRLLCIDKDPAAIARAKALQAEDPRVTVHHGSFAQLAALSEEAEVQGKINGILVDLGVSSPQLDQSDRGFSFRQDGPLDMRMDTTQPLTAATWINTATPEQIAKVLRTYGEESFANRIAHAIEKRRTVHPFITTLDLAETIANAIPKKFHGKKHPATKSFQAIRIFVNQELTDLENLLPQTLTVLAPYGRLAVISFHSLEDRMVKQFICQQSRAAALPKEIPIQAAVNQCPFKIIGKAFKASEIEIAENIRSRSARLRIAERTTIAQELLVCS